MRVKPTFAALALLAAAFGPSVVALSGIVETDNAVRSLAVLPAPLIEAEQKPGARLVSIPLESIPEDPAESILEDPADGIPEDQVAPHRFSRTIRVGKGDTLMELLVGAGVPRGEAHEAITALKELYDPRKLKPGQDLILTFAAAGPGGGRISGMSLPVRYDLEVAVARDGNGGFVATRVERELEHKPVWAGHVIRSSLFEAGLAAGVPAAVMIDLIRAYSYEVDFQRDIRKGDRFEVMFERLYDNDRGLAYTGDLLYAALTLGRTTLEIYRHQPAGGEADYFNGRGESIRKDLLRTPIDGARISSRYGKRKHPILGYTKMHRGVDFAAPKGTPIYAAGDGVIVALGRNGASGKYVRIRHNSQYTTAYGHLSRYAKGMESGRRVKQGEVIGYVGSTGRSTGPHLHYEVSYQGSQINPMSLKLPAGYKLEGEELTAFQEARAQIERQLLALSAATRLASGE